MAASSTSTSSSTAVSSMFPKPADANERFNLLRSVGEECISDEGLKNLAEKKPDIRCYDGFEPSGRMHIAQGLFKAANVNKCAAADCTFVFWVADWFALMNDKMGGDLASIQLVGKYFVEVWKAAGMDMSHVEFQWASEEITKNAVDYWTRVLDIGRRNTVNRIKKCCQIMGRTDGSLSAAQILYPLMQCADIFFLKADVCQLGVDQRKVNMLAREYCDQIGRKLKPVILSHHMLAGLKKGQGKMSKSDPDSAIFMEDPREEVHRKIMQAYCPVKALPDSKIDEEGATEADDDKNPCLEYIRYVLFSRPNPTFTVKVDDNKKSFTSFEAIQDEFVNGNISEVQLKEGLIDAINELLEPIRQHFLKDADASKLLDEVRDLRAKVAAAAAAAAAEKKEQQQPDPAAAASASSVTNNAKPHAVAWLPCSLKVPLAQLFAIVQQLNNFLAANKDADATLVLPDWTYFAQGFLRGELKDIAAALEYHADICVQALGLNPAVKVVKQSTDLISKDPNKFWISAIGAGRKFKLTDIESTISTPVDQAGQVIASLMHCADVDCLGATTLIGDATNSGHNKLAGQYVAITSNNSIKCDFIDVTGNLTNLPPETLCDPTTKPVSANDWLFADESDNDVRKKIKGAYCAPGNTATPVLDMACFLIQHIQGKLLIERNEANGGNKEYTDSQSLIADFGSSALHPGDLKASVSKGIATLYSSKIAPCIGGAAQKQRALVLKNAEKKAAKN